MNRPTAEERRRDYLRIGLDMLREFDVEHPTEVSAMADIRVSDVARRAGVSKGALYHIWPSQEAYRQDLLAYLLDEREQTGLERSREYLARVAALEVEGADLIRLGAESTYENLLHDHRYLARFGFALYAAHGDVQQLLERAAEIELASFLPSVSGTLERLGRRPRAPFTVHSLAVALCVCFNGYIVQGRLTPSLVQDAKLVDEHGEWTAFGAASRSIIEHFTEPEAARAA